MATSPTKRGLTTITWGTSNAAGGANNAAGLNTAIIESISITPKNGAPIELEDNDGFAIAAVMLNDGFDATLTAMHDTNRAWPGENDVVVLSLPSVATSNAAARTNYNTFVVCDPAVTLTRKKEAMVEIKVARRPGILA